MSAALQTEFVREYFSKFPYYSLAHPVLRYREDINSSVYISKATSLAAQ